MNNRKKYIYIWCTIISIFTLLIFYFFVSLRRLEINKGFSIIDYVLYGIGFITILVLTIYYDVISNKEINDYIADKNNKIKENIKKILTARYYIYNFKDEEEEIITKEDCEVFTAYDSMAEDKLGFIEPYDIEYDYIWKMKRKDKQILFLGNEYERTIYEYRSSYKIYNMNFCILKEIDNKNRLHIKTKGYIEKKIMKFEDVFEDCEKNVEKYDEQYSKKYEIYFHKEELAKAVNSNEKKEYIKLTDAQKELLLDLYNKTKLNFSLILQNGIMRIYVNVSERLSYYKKIDENILAENVSDIIIKLIEEF